jgi:SAM-dependent methyltransferase
MKTCQFEAGSCRDRSSSVLHHDGEIYRILRSPAVPGWTHLRDSQLFARRTADGSLVRTREVNPEEVGFTSPEGCEILLHHQRIPFISYPYEWSFSMLKDAARLTLDLLCEALEERLTLRDATPYNVQWQGTRPVFIDIPSFGESRSGVWMGYSQFCQLFLFPLMLQAYRDVDFRPWLRGSLDGIPADQCKAMMSSRDLLKPGVLMHVHLHASLQARPPAQTGTDLRQEIAEAGFHEGLLKANSRRLRQLVEKLEWRRGRTAWSDYGTGQSYDEEEQARKADFVRAAASDRARRLVWDLGCNVGFYSRIAAEHADYVVAADADGLTIERLYNSLSREKNLKILPLVINVADPPPALGWRGTERKNLPDRGRPDLVLGLAVLHHICITANIRVPEFLDWVASMGADLVLEFVTRQDPMVEALLLHREDLYSDYDLAPFEGALETRFEVLRREEVCPGRRILYYARPRTA